MGGSDLLAHRRPDETQPISGNVVTPMVNGEAAYPQMLAAIENARCSISLATYYFANDKVGDLFCGTLAAAVARGVKVRVLIDGRALFRRMFLKLRKCGITVRHQILPPRRTRRFVSRYHRRILIVDGRLGFSGGMTIRAAQMVNSGDPKVNQDVHFRIEGPIISILQSLFTRDWHDVSSELLEGEEWYPLLERHGDATVRPLVTGPGYPRALLETFLCRAISSAKQRIDVVTPYFLPTDALRSALADAVRRRVMVRLLIPQYNFAVVEWASNRHLELLLKEGCIILATPPPFDHSKLMTIDEDWSLIGSANWDPLSLFVNSEVNFEVHDNRLRQHLGRIVEEKAAKALPVTLSNVSTVSRTKKLLCWLIEAWL